MDRLIELVNLAIKISAEEEQIIRSYFEKVEIKNKTELLRQGQKSNQLYFIEKGLIHTYYYHDDKEVTSWFYAEENFVTSWYSFLSQAPSFEYLRALEDTTAHTITYSKLQQLYKECPAFERFGRILAEQNLAFLESYSKGYMFLSAKEKYDLLNATIPDITLRVKLGQIASFLGISQETLSRLRSKK
ncbi:Crp/Fnr family transcriptional regulator [Prolixibacteraceae bacterium JC049]|nr:Crp/Fnr family transcriptional regulator [Prolixibacteraceae bacterium JC049]